VVRGSLFKIVKSEKPGFVAKLDISKAILSIAKRV